MNIRCPGCGAAAEYSVSNQKMICAYCGLRFSPSEADGKREYEHVDGGDAKMEGFPKGLDSDKW